MYFFKNRKTVIEITFTYDNFFLAAMLFQR